MVCRCRQVVALTIPYLYERFVFEMNNARAYDVGLVLSSSMRTKSAPDLGELLPSLIISRAFPPISSTVLPVPYAKKYTSAKRVADWVIVSANTLSGAYANGDRKKRFS